MMDIDLLDYVQFKFLGNELITCAGQTAKIVALSKEIDQSETLTITISIKAVRVFSST